MTEFEIAASALERYRVGEMTFPYLVLELEQAVSLAECRGSSSAEELRRIWAQLEIINALALDEETDVPQPDAEVDELAGRLLSIFATIGGRREN